jgi:predicted DNA-binding protein (MmcQ/YjbR family)
MNKKHWNTIQLQGNLPRGEIERMMDNSYTLVVRSLPRGVRQSLEIKYGPDSIYR